MRGVSNLIGIHLVLSLHLLYFSVSYNLAHVLKDSSSAADLHRFHYLICQSRKLSDGFSRGYRRSRQAYLRKQAAPVSADGTQLQVLLDSAVTAAVHEEIRRSVGYIFDLE